ncbi:MAG: hypothetical protein V4642_14055 [Bacteroidota bacterium]
MKTTFARLIMVMCFGTIFLTGCEQRIVSPDSEYSSNGFSNKGNVKTLSDTAYEVEFNILLDSLHLSADQLAAIDVLKTQKAECMDSARSNYDRGRSEWAKAYAAERKAVQDSVKAGVISRDSSQNLMFDIAKRQSNDTTNKASRDSMKVAFKACTEAYNTGFYALLTDEQKVIWDAWMAIHKIEDVEDDEKTGKDTDKSKRRDAEKRRDGDRKDAPKKHKKD